MRKTVRRNNGLKKGCCVQEYVSEILLQMQQKPRGYCEMCKYIISIYLSIHLRIYLQYISIYLIIKLSLCVLYLSIFLFYLILYIPLCFLSLSPLLISLLHQRMVNKIQSVSLSFHDQLFRIYINRTGKEFATRWSQVNLFTER